ncbi:MAG: SufS family cysteine desulfurase [Pantoea sp. Brub]|nr:SufS family cysteine desulfurase [Pantoea sp. Brub]
MKKSAKEFNLEKIRSDFPILKRKINNHPLTYFDNAASTQRPIQVINAENYFYQNDYSNVHRGIHTLSMQATMNIENIRTKLSKFLNTKSKEEIIFVKGTTEGINLVANSLFKNKLSHINNVIITEMEHHSNIVPWQILAQNTGIEIRILPLTNNGELDLNKIDQLIDKNTKLLAITHVSNVLGIINPIKKIIAQAKAAGLITLVDGAQAIMHNKIDVQDIGCDFYVFSSHKMYGPNGIGVLYGKEQLLHEMSPWEGGGAMIENVLLPTGTTWNDIPWRFEAGTPNIGGIIGLGAALDYINEIGLHVIHQREKTLMHYLQDKLVLVPDIQIYSPLHNNVGIIAFNLGNHLAFDVGSFLDQYGIAIRTGHHCAMPLMRFYKVKSMCRVSFAFYNSEKEIDRLISSLIRIHTLLKKHSSME